MFGKIAEVGRTRSRWCPVWSAAWLLFFAAGSSAYDLSAVPRDLTVPGVTRGEPRPGHRVRQQLPEYEGTEVHHLVYLPTDWVEGRSFPVIVEYAGNQYRDSPGTVEGSRLGYGLSGGKGFLWVCVPFVDREHEKNATRWWGDVAATVDYCHKTVKSVCSRLGGDPDKVILAGFSRGAIACNYIGLSDDRIARLWRGFFCHSHYDGVNEGWPYPGADRQSAVERLRRLAGRAQFISQEGSTEAVEAYLAAAVPGGKFTFVPAKFADHTDGWVLRKTPEREVARRWLHSVVSGRGRP